MIKSSNQVRIVGIDPAYSKPHAFAVLRYSPKSYSHPQSRAKLMLEDCGFLTANSPYLKIEEMENRLRWLDVNNTLPTLAFVENVYLGKNVQTMQKMAMMLGTIINFFERNSIECELVENTKWERPIFKNGKFNEEYQKKVKIELIKEDFYKNEIKLNSITSAQDDLIDAILIARYGALNYLNTYMKSMAV